MPFDLKSERVKAKMSQLRLCMDSGVSRWRFRLAEAGLINLRPHEVEKIARVLKKSTEVARGNDDISAPVRL